MLFREAISSVVESYAFFNNLIVPYSGKDCVEKEYPRNMENINS